MSHFLELEAKYSLDIYPKRDIVLVKGKNSHVWDDEGNKYLDCVSGHGVANIGHQNEMVIDAITKQAKELITCSNIFYNNKRALLLEKLVDISPAKLNKAFLCNSGAESIEAALKFARFATGKTDFICTMRGFHGRTMGALSATYLPKYRDAFQPLIPGFIHVPFNKIEKIKQKINKNTAAVLLEIVQAEGGVYIGSDKYFQEVQTLCKEKGILLIIDEVQTGFCRTGKMFACDYHNLEPDMLCIAKSIAGGLPMGAVLCSDKIDVPVGKHGTTFGGNPLVCAASLAAIKYMQDNKLDKEAFEKGEYFKTQFEKRAVPKVREIRQIGLMIGIELKEKSQPHIQKLMEHGILALPAGATVIRLLPPLTIGYEDLDYIVDKIEQVLTSK